MREAVDRLAAQRMRRLLPCRVDQAALLLDMMQAIAASAGNLQTSGKTNRHGLRFTAHTYARRRA